MLRHRPGAARPFAAQFPEARHDRPAADLLDDDDLEAVVVATPVPSHHALAKRALEAGKHVFVEKPLAWTTAEARELEMLAAERSLHADGRPSAALPPWRGEAARADRGGPWVTCSMSTATGRTWA